MKEGKYWDQGIQLIDGCSEVSPGCDNCWSREMSGRFTRAKHLVKDGKWTGEIRVNGDFLERISRKKPTVFSIWNDIGHREVHEDFIEELMAKFIENPQHTGLLLTKRPENIAIHFNFFGPPPPNVWLGTTVENQEQADKRIPELLKCPGNLFLSLEPLLGPVDLMYPKSLYPNGPQMCCDGYECGCQGKPIDVPVIMDSPGLQNRIKAVILGGETGHNARPPELGWIRKIRDDCEAAGVPFFLKHIDKKHERMLDGRTHDALPWRE